MSHNLNVRSARPILQQLEDRIQPSFLLAGAIGAQFVSQLNDTIFDLKGAIVQVKAQHDALIALGPGGSQATAELDYAAGVSSYEQVEVQQLAIQHIVSADIAFIRAAALAEFTEGDPTDELILFFGPLLGIDATKALTDIVAQANNLINNDSTFQTDINTDFNGVSPIITHATFAQAAAAPTF